MKKHRRNTDITAGTLEHLREGDADALDKVFVAYYPGVFSFMAALMGSPEAGKEITRQIFVNLWNNRDRINPNGDFTDQLHKIVRRTVISFLLYSRIGESEKIVEKNARDFDNSSIENDAETLVDIVVNRLPYPAANVVSMSKDEKLNPYEISLRLNIPVEEIEEILKKTADEVHDVLTKFILIFMTK